MRAVDITTAPHYRWGAASDGWRLLEGADLTVIQERVPPGDAERRHRHARARQFFTRSPADVEMLVISSPRSHGDRVDI